MMNHHLLSALTLSLLSVTLTAQNFSGPHRINSIPLYPIQSDSADLDNDGDVDLILADIGGVLWFENLGNDAFGPEQVLSTGLLWAFSVHVAIDVHVNNHQISQIRRVIRQQLLGAESTPANILVPDDFVGIVCDQGDIHIAIPIEVGRMCCIGIGRR